MRIASVRKQRRGGLYEVRGADGSLIIACSGEILSRFGLYEDEEPSEETVRKARREQQRLRATQLALDMLARRSASRAELLRKLRGKGVAESHAKEAAAAMQSLGYLDDSRFADELCEYYFGEKLYGARRVKAELMRRGIDRDTADSALERFDVDPEARAEAFVRRRFGSVEGLTRESLKRIYGTLLRNGYSYSQACRAIKAVAGDETMELDDGEYC